MEVKQVLCMNGGDGADSYAMHSRFAGRIASATKPILEKSIQDLLCNGFSSKILTAADLGCASGPNMLSVVSTIINTVEKVTQESKQPTPEIHLFLNDLPWNDFNYIFRRLPAFCREIVEGKEKVGLPCYIAGVPGSFHGRLFPKKSLHLVHSSYGVHWLSQVPPGLYSKEGLPLNKGKIFMSKTSPPLVFKAYLEQFQKDFHSFLRSRSEEVQPNGVMVLVLVGRPTADPSSMESCHPWESLSEILSSMVLEGVFSEEKVDSFDVPYYIPSVEEVGNIVENEGSFNIERLELLALDVEDMPGELVAKNIRCFTESLIERHFGREITDQLYRKLTCAAVKDLEPLIHNPTSIMAVLWKK